MTDKAMDGIVRKTSVEGKRAWTAPRIETAPARGASAFGGPPGGVDYGFYS